MSFEKHLFISYAHIDNQPLTPEAKGWITRFHGSLAAILSMRMGGKANIWRDDKLQGNDVFADEIIDQFKDTAVLVSVLTPRYLNSEWCTKEVVEFCKSAEQSGGFVVENKARIFKVLKTPVDSQEPLPDVVQDVLGYEFYTFEDETPLELDPAYGEEFAQEYNRKVGKLAWDISQLLKMLADQATQSGNGTKADEDAQDQPSTDKPTVYLAECSRDRKEIREILDGELRRHGYTVLPHKKLPIDVEEEYIAEVNSLLERCKFSIHLIGESFGSVPEGESQKSVVVLQNELAAQRSKDNGLVRVIWLPDGTRSTQAPQQVFIEALHKDAEIQFGADLISDDVEHLKTAVLSKLRQLEKPAPPPAEPSGEAESDAAEMRPLIYVICTEKDRSATVPLRKFCRDKGLDVAIPAFEGDASTIRAAHRQSMADCDAIILFYGDGGEGWKRTIDSELKKMPGYRAGRPLLACHTYLDGPETADKADLIEMEEPNLINGLADFSESQMEEFLEAINPNGATT